ncbi:type II toxin-antitoxin system HicA family toxin [Desulfotignum phosphitoxidans]|jgi:lysophospholipid acyltransferase (LPLAT)-like uncharacterized protein|uniref:type II toxin-antitoxin system HicA family toxin n=1 Tax=Desulfotignum phosphitoxidans TaxID=190898 RepID=UPI000586F4A7|nr:type II toxin-antitoxin system HicA family toxin [Desulfotignum phosphitoxidans]
MNTKHRKTLAAIFKNPTNGNMEWKMIEALFTALGCRVIEGSGGSGVTFEKDGVRAYFHRPHPDKAALKYRVKDARDFLTRIGEAP